MTTSTVSELDSRADATNAGDSSPANKAFLAQQFKKGQSGNPNGRPKKVDAIADLARENGDKAIRKLVKLIDSDDDRVALQAATAVLDRAVGKPKQALDVTRKQDAADYTESELLAIARMGGTGTH